MEASLENRKNHHEAQGLRLSPLPAAVTHGAQPALASLELGTLAPRKTQVHPLCVTQGCNSIICCQQCDTATLHSSDAVSCTHPTRKLLDAATSCSCQRSNTGSHHLIGQVWVRCVCVLIQIPCHHCAVSPRCRTLGKQHQASSTGRPRVLALGPWGTVGLAAGWQGSAASEGSSPGTG